MIRSTIGFVKFLCDEQINRYRCAYFIAQEATRIIAHPRFSIVSGIHYRLIIMINYYD